MIKYLFCVLLLAGFAAFGAISTPAQGTSKAYWHGRVDNKVHLVISGTSIEHRTIEGQAMPDGSYSFTAPLPRSEVTVGARRIEGRSNKVSVIQQPNAANNYQAIVEIIDDGGGAREYFIEIFW
jgi:hypothetical protein